MFARQFERMRNADQAWWIPDGDGDPAGILRARLPAGRAMGSIVVRIVPALGRWGSGSVAASEGCAPTSAAGLFDLACAMKWPEKL